ncbi:type-F conjugative transfer system protein TraW [Novosphingobium album (ex Liu et al. 2023)]|uniref:Type-F conjugative transfer system protein TraW n=1 Tax=Novosphingobium album (ex Liu et al. 2023) TaxID=3031130 RepID=A0ABT5WSX4_9SPHN|nr:type-F conjugative transfer system protein TraW [Novosphingobium album (ex Liu et al. 2023)]MDE8652856.1 type-F conjugative transfer system protein TraW [Novosphingobium album (ex Liu et al. 2023)]
MRAVLGGGIALLGVAAAVLLVGPMRSEAKDYGQSGQTFPIIEPDLLSTIEARLRRAEASGELARMNDVFAKRVEAKVRRPQPVEGITPARTARSWDYDPTVAIERDIRDQKGNLIAAAGQKINPLDFVAVRQDLVFIDGDNAAQLAWATARYTDLKAKIIFVNGSPIEQMTAKKRRFYFDQEGKLTGTFGIEHTPAVVSQAGKVMRVSEMVIKPGSPG